MTKTPKTDNNRLGKFLVHLAEGYLTRRARRRYVQATKAKRRGLILDWLFALVWAVGWVFVINQYLVQAYQIPSESMETTLNVGDRIFVNKLIFGPEVLPTMGKLPSPVKPKRGDIIIFQSPEYHSYGPAFEVAHRLIYMISFSTININRNAVDLLIKRAIGFDGDQIVMRNGDFYIRARGESSFMKESEFIKKSNLQYTPRRLLPEDEYENSRNIVIKETYENNGIELPAELNYLADLPPAERFSQFYIDEQRIRESSQNYTRAQLNYQFYPWMPSYRSDFYHAEQGIYVPAGSVLPLGDNRDNSHDGRAWGIIRQNDVLGKTLFRFWPLNRLGGI